MSALEPGKPWAPGDLLVMLQPQEWSVPAGWTLVSTDGRTAALYRHATEAGHGDRDMYVTPPWMGEAITSAVQP